VFRAPARSFFPSQCPFYRFVFLPSRAQHGAKSALVCGSWMRVFGSSFFHSLPSVFVFQLAFVWLLVADFFRSRSGQSGSWGRGVCKLQLPAGAVVGFFFRLVLGCYSCGCTRCACVDMSTLHFQIISD